MRECEEQEQEQEQVLNIKALRAGLTSWGRYWAYQELGKGYASRSACDLLGEVQVCGSTIGHELSVPKHVAEFDRGIERLPFECLRAIRTHYICKGQWSLMGFDSQKSYLYWLRRGELLLL
ncbi:hypothetical protein [Shewanella sp. Isolate11]|uniref:hypothetical protein n=1 Tax=Shewanella sp. Isolate11 TaxID=2908530 RepID=UPI001EFD0325|nr:hypothetical protein [Shewanella sp. Isolate11]MCG9697441.1 hypothetical protein [Shewanella sp. Isolate11]